MGKNYSAKIQFTGYMDTKGSEWEGVGEYDVKDAIDDMSEEELRNWMKFNLEAVLSSRKKD